MMKFFRISITEDEEDDFFLITDLTSHQVSEVIEPMIVSDREGDEEFDMGIAIKELRRKYPRNVAVLTDGISELKY